MSPHSTSATADSSTNSPRARSIDFVEAIDAIDVRVVQRRDAEVVHALVLANHGEGRTRHAITHAEPSTHSLGEGCLARAQLPDEQHDVAGAQHPSERFARSRRASALSAVSPPAHGARHKPTAEREGPRALPRPRSGPPRNAAAG